MGDLLGHQLLLTPTARCAVVLRLPAELKRLLNAAAQSGERVAFRVSEKGGSQQVCIVVACWVDCSGLSCCELALDLCCCILRLLLQATLTVGSKEHNFIGNSVAKQTLLRLTTSEDDNGGVVASITHKLHQRVGGAGLGTYAGSTGGH